jgi:hypothetical protein
VFRLAMCHALAFAFVSLMWRLTVTFYGEQELARTMGILAVIGFSRAIWEIAKE